MKAYEARRLAYCNNKAKEQLDQIYPKIYDAAKLGKFEIELNIHGLIETITQLQLDGYNIGTRSKKVSPNESEYFLRIRW